MILILVAKSQTVDQKISFWSRFFSIQFKIKKKTIKKKRIKISWKQSNVKSGFHCTLIDPDCLKYTPSKHKITHIKKYGKMAWPMDQLATSLVNRRSCQPPARPCIHINPSRENMITPTFVMPSQESLSPQHENLTRMINFSNLTGRWPKF